MIVLYDFPHDTPKRRALIRRFRRFLFQLGFERLQYSVYVRSIPRRESAHRLLLQIRTKRPPDGSVLQLVLPNAQLFKDTKLRKIIKRAEVALRFI